MTILQGIIMGIVQGLTEFLPVSSSGHLALFRQILGAGPAVGIGFEVAVHMGTLLSVLVFFRVRISKILLNLFKGGKEGVNYSVWIIVGTIPAGVFGILLKSRADDLFNNLFSVGIAWIFTAFVLYFSEKLSNAIRTTEDLNWKKALFVGIAQAIAIIPGISRSGSTISAGLLMKFKKEEAVEFAFILSIPAIFGAGLITAKDWFDGSVALGMVDLVGGIAAAVFGYIAIAWMLKIVTKGKMFWFAVYCAVLGTTSIIVSLI